MSTLPPLLDLLASVHNSQSPSSADSILATVLSLLFESSPTLLNRLVPEYARRLKGSSDSDLPTNYSDVVDQSLGLVHDWSWSNKAEFVGGHPRIGEVKGLSALSSAEQGQAGAPAPTPPEVLARLARLNAIYEKRYPGLIYITFVNGRSRAAIKDEMEAKLGVPGGEAVDAEAHGRVSAGSDEWVREVRRAIDDVGKIAKSRLAALGVE